MFPMVPCQRLDCFSAIETIVSKRISFWDVHVLRLHPYFRHRNSPYKGLVLQSQI